MSKTFRFSPQTFFSDLNGKVAMVEVAKYTGKEKKKRKPHTATGKVHSDLNNEMGDHVHGIPQKITVQNQLCSVTQNFHNNYNYDLL